MSSPEARALHRALSAAGATPTQRRRAFLVYRCRGYAAAMRYVREMVADV